MLVSADVSVCVALLNGYVQSAPTRCSITLRVADFYFVRREECAPTAAEFRLRLKPRGAAGGGTSVRGE